RDRGGDDREPTARGVSLYLRYRTTGRPPSAADVPEPDDPHRHCPFWDWDPAVLVRDLDRMAAADRRRAVDGMPFLLGNADERVRARAVEVLTAAGQTAHVIAVVKLLGEPRLGAGESVAKLLACWDTDQIEDAARAILHSPAASPAQLAWALDQ